MEVRIPHIESDVVKVPRKPLREGAGPSPDDDRRRGSTWKRCALLQGAPDRPQRPVTAP